MSTPIIISGAEPFQLAGESAAIVFLVKSAFEQYDHNRLYAEAGIGAIEKLSAIPNDYKLEIACFEQFIPLYLLLNQI